MHRWFAVALVLLTALATSTVASAGGWAITTLDEVPSEVTARATYAVGFTVLQHGSRPADGLQTGITIRSTRSGQSLDFPAQADGRPGHYVAEVRFPTSGEWAWEVHLGYFPMQELGAVRVTPEGSGIDPVMALEGKPIEANDAWHWSRPFEASRLPLAVATLVSLLLFARSLLSIARPAADTTARVGRVIG